MTGSVSGAPGRWRTLVDWYHRLLNWLLVLLLTILIVPVSLQIFSRYTELIPSYIWTEEMARVLFVWMIMIGAMTGIREGTHFLVDIWPRMAPRAEALVRLFASFCVLVVALVFVWAGIEFTRFAWHRISELAELPLWLIHIAWPIAGASWLIFLGEQMGDDLRLLLRGPA